MADDTFQVDFQVHCPWTSLGDRIRVVGSTAELGNWDVNQSLELETSADNFPLWKAEGIEVSARNSLIEFKCFVERPFSDLWWEETPNRRLFVPPTGGSPSSQRISFVFGEFGEEMSSSDGSVVEVCIGHDSDLSPESTVASSSAPSSVQLSEDELAAQAIMMSDLCMLSEVLLFGGLGAACNVAAASRICSHAMKASRPALLELTMRFMAASPTVILEAVGRKARRLASCGSAAGSRSRGGSLAVLGPPLRPSHGAQDVEFRIVVSAPHRKATSIPGASTLLLGLTTVAPGSLPDPCPEQVSQLPGASWLAGPVGTLWCCLDPSAGDTSPGEGWERWLGPPAPWHWAGEVAGLAVEDSGAGWSGLRTGHTVGLRITKDGDLLTLWNDAVVHRWPASIVNLPQEDLWGVVRFPPPAVDLLIEPLEC
mmetsp:Transcript_69693/g.130060  ORF Transcript_69693/g.130060 Transcript_69693/m.130060 type:complete len:426 (-) Transcript_69693:149-1426(-)